MRTACGRAGRGRPARLVVDSLIFTFLPNGPSGILAGQRVTTPPGGMEVVWLHRPRPGSQPRLLADALLAGPWLPGRADVFAHGERESMKAVRAALKARLAASAPAVTVRRWGRCPASRAA